MSKSRKRHQVKSSCYYLFWGIATVAVVAGQVYIGSGYHAMATEVKSLVEVANDR